MHVQRAPPDGSQTAATLRSNKAKRPSRPFMSSGSLGHPRLALHCAGDLHVRRVQPASTPNAVILTKRSPGLGRDDGRRTTDDIAFFVVSLSRKKSRSKDKCFWFSHQPSTFPRIWFERLSRDYSSRRVANFPHVRQRPSSAHALFWETSKAPTPT